MVKIHWQNFLTGADDRTIDNVTFLSRPREWHAVVVGFVAYYLPGIIQAGLVPGTEFVPPELGGPLGAILYLVGRSNKGLAQGILEGETQKLTINHLRDAVKEPAYAGGGYVLAAALSYATAFVPTFV